MLISAVAGLLLVGARPAEGQWRAPPLIAEPAPIEWRDPGPARYHAAPSLPRLDPRPEDSGGSTKVLSFIGGAFMGGLLLGFIGGELDRRLEIFEQGDDPGFTGMIYGAALGAVGGGLLLMHLADESDPADEQERKPKERGRR